MQVVPTKTRSRLALLPNSANIANVSSRLLNNLRLFEKI